jgi:hypothetical protein
VEPIFNNAPLPPPPAAERPPKGVIDDLAKSRELIDWFFQTCTNPVAGGSLPEDEWYDLYCSVCRRNYRRPLPLESFRRIARSYLERDPVRGSIRQIDGVWHYYGALPLIPQGAA